VISALSAGAHPSNSAAIRPVASTALAKSMPANHSHGAVQRDIGVKDSVRLTVREDPLPRSERKHRAAADRRGRLRMPSVGVMQISLDKRRADILGLGVRQQWADLRPGAVSANEKLGAHARPVGEGQRVPAAAQHRDAR
jgi:hypothetical protein